MNSVGDEFHCSEVDEFILKDFNDEDADMVVMMSILEEIEKEGDHVLNFWGLIKGMIVFVDGRIKGAHDLSDDFFKPDSVYIP